MVKLIEYYDCEDGDDFSVMTAQICKGKIPY